MLVVGVVVVLFGLFVVVVGVAVVAVAVVVAVVANLEVVLLSFVLNYQQIDDELMIKNKEVNFYSFEYEAFNGLLLFA